MRVYFEDTDTGGVVYHANYLRFMERARSDLLRLIGIDQRTDLENGTGVYVVAGVDIRYRAPARLDDELLIETRPLSIGAASITLQQTIRHGDTVVTDAEVRVGFTMPDGRPQRQPRDRVARFSALEQLLPPAGRGL